MKAELDKKLVESFPNLYQDRRADMQYTAICWGFECGDGWYDLLFDLSRRLEEKIVELKKKNPPVRFYKIKKKLDRLLSHINFRLITYFGFKHPIGSKLTNFISFFRPNLGVEYFPCASQVKEKYGTLRFYTTYETEEMSQLISIAERKSAITCETCGKLGKRNNYGWVTTLCDECRGFNLEEAEREFEEQEDKDDEDSDEFCK